MSSDNKLTQYVFNKMGVPNFQKYLDLSAYRHKLISGNVSNASTPGYKAKDIDFQKEFDKATSKTNHLQGMVTSPGHIPLGSHPGRAPKVNEDKVETGEMNSIDIDHEVSSMTQNELLYTISAKLLQRKFEGLKNAITSK